MKRVLIIFLPVILFIEIGMRIAIWQALNATIPQNTTYDLEVILLNNSLTGSCEAYSNGENRYMDIPYSLWLLTILESRMICEYQSPYIILRTDSPNLGFYHWSFHQLGFNKNPSWAPN